MMLAAWFDILCLVDGVVLLVMHLYIDLISIHHSGVIRVSLPDRVHRSLRIEQLVFGMLVLTLRILTDEGRQTPDLLDYEPLVLHLPRQSTQPDIDKQHLTQEQQGQQPQLREYLSLLGVVVIH